MTRVHPIRPLGESDLAALRVRFDKTFSTWAHDWIAVPGRRLASIFACTTEEALASIDPLEEGVVLAVDGSALLWAPRTNLIQLGRACVLEGDKLFGDTRLDEVMTDLGRSALCELLGSFADVSCGEAEVAVGVDALTPAHFGFSGVKIVLQIGTVDIFCFVARSVLTNWLAVRPQSVKRLLPVKLPERLGKKACKVTAQSSLFEVPAADFLALAPGDVLTLDQHLDTHFELRILDLPSVSLKSYPGRCGQVLAVEVFENS